MSDAIEIEATPVAPKRIPAAGRPLSTTSAKRQIELARHHGRRALLVGIRRLTAYLGDPKSPIDAFYLRAFSELASRCGLPAMTAQQVDATSLTATLDGNQVEQMARRLLGEVIEGEQRSADGN